ncbi:MAG: DUF192 domain-containing protein [Dehalococcoidia bacterium]
MALAMLALAMAGCRGGNSDKTFEVRISEGSTEATVTVEIAATTKERQQGLMFRQELDEDKGMLFLFPRDVLIGFWMKNTYIPLDIAYVSAEGEVLEVRAAKPLDETTLMPAKEYRYTLEVNRGWFERHGLDVGARVEIPKGLPTATE